MSLEPERLARAYRACEALAHSHDENFPVASRLLPGPMRPHVAAVYAFARVADDIADEGADPPAVRKERLRAWQVRLHEAAGASPRRRPDTVDAPAESRDELIFVALGHSIRSLNLPLPLFDDLLSAFGQDITTTRYDSWSAVLDYCRRSANPIGRLVLRIAGRGDALAQSSDALCTALQLTNFWQDFGRDWQAGRLYVPRSVQEACGAREGDLAGGSSLTPAWVQAIEQCATVTRDLFDQGKAVCDGVNGRLRLELRLTWLGGRRVLDRVVERRASLPLDRPTLGAADVPALLWRVARWNGSAA